MATIQWLIIAVLLLLIVGFCALTYLVVKLQTHYNRLTHGVGKETLTQVLNGFLEELRAVKSRTTQLETVTRELAADGVGHVQKIGVVRFNPFTDTGGAQSFTMAILDGKGSGVVMTSLFARTGNRWYVKQIEDGRGKNIELSKEEMAAIQDARNIP